MHALRSDAAESWAAPPSAASASSSNAWAMYTSFCGGEENRRDAAETRREGRPSHLVALLERRRLRLLLL